MNKLVYYAGLYTASAGLLKLAGFIIFLWLARTLPVDDYAQFGLLYSLQTGLMTFGLVGIVEAVIGLLKSHRSADEQKKLFSAANSSFLCTLVTALVFSWIIFSILVKRTDVSFITLASVLASGALLAFATLQAQTVRLQEKHFSSLCFNFVMPMAGVAGSFIAFYLERTVQSFFLGSVIGLLIAIAGLSIGRIGFYGVADTLAEMRPILLRVSPFIAVAFLGWLGGYGNNYVIKLLFEPREIAKFTFAFSLSSIMQLVATALNQVWSPRFFHLIHELPHDEVEIKNRNFYRLQGLAMGVIGGVVIAFFPAVMSMLGGNLISYKSMGVELLCLFTAYVFLSPWWHCNNYLLAHDNGSSIMRITVVTSIIGIAVWLLMMILLGPIGIYIGFMIQMLLRSVGIFLVTKKRWSLKISWDGVVVGMVILFVGFAFSRT